MAQSLRYHGFRSNGILSSDSQTGIVSLRERHSDRFFKAKNNMVQVLNMLTALNYCQFLTCS